MCQSQTIPWASSLNKHLCLSIHLPYISHWSISLEKNQINTLRIEFNFFSFYHLPYLFQACSRLLITYLM
jgi:hypothetical protein